jgi:hypothetical protein
MRLHPHMWSDLDWKWGNDYSHQGRTQAWRQCYWPTCPAIQWITPSTGETWIVEPEKEHN